ncbi:MAG: RES family NAD+ phosphorylase [Parvularculaceae bacterium]
MTAPFPPDDIERRSPLAHFIDADEILSRFYGQAWGPIYFDRGKQGRLNAPDGAYGVLYAAVARRGSFAETFLRRSGDTLIARDFVAARAHVSLRVRAPLKLVKLFGNGLARLGATAEVTHGGLPYAAPQQWSAALHDHGGRFDGIAYTARHNDSEICAALFERAAAKIEEVSRETDLDQDWFYDLANHHGVAIALD